MEIAKKKGVTPSQLTLSWLLARGNNIFPNPGTTQLARLEENMAGLDIGLKQDEIRKLRDACENADVRGARYAEGTMTTFADTPAL
ncbi:putative aldo/keto reductase [Colletotrichum truncatum]|uniref:Aldo/keto reductase n=1 Tax=Colletotrichum truncatum TaxID=5467 RepID=A0ACC3YJD9_COLTU